MNDFLSDEDLFELTRVKQPSAQKRILTKNKIFFVERADNTLLVCLHHVHYPMIKASNDVESDMDWDKAS